MNWRYGIGAALMAGLACNSGLTDPGVAGSGRAPSPLAVTQVEDSMQFLRPAVGAPALAQKVVSFYAVRGEDRRAEIWYHPRAGEPDSSRLVRLKLDKRSLENAPDGTPIAQGDSLLITMTVADTLKLIVDMQPAGLVFADNREAKLTMWYIETDPDLNLDGVVDTLDAQLEATLTTWRQENPGDLWQQLSGVLDTVDDQIETEITGFTRYAVSY